MKLRQPQTVKSLPTVTFLISAFCLVGVLPAAGKQEPAGKQVEMFTAMKQGQLDVRLIPKDAKITTVILTNKTDQPLRIKLPEAFAGVPVLAQVGDNDDGGGGGGNSNSNQSLGGGMGMGGMGMGGMGMGGGFFNIRPGKVRRFKVATVCLEHGKDDPNPRIPYEIQPIESVTEDATVIQICKMLGRREVSQQVAQAAAWHLTDDLSWPELSRKIKIRHLNGSIKLYFSGPELVQAQRALAIAQQRARASERTEKVESGDVIRQQQDVPISDQVSKL